MLAWFAPGLITSKVIQNAHYAPMMGVQLLKLPFGEHQSYFKIQNAQKFHECRFYSYISSLKPPSNFTSKYQAEQYKQACEKLAQFRQVYQLICQIDEFNSELKYLYNICQKNVAQSNIFSKSEETSQIFETDVIDALNRYTIFIKNLVNYPEWHDKVVEQIGKWFHMIHNNLEESEAKQNIFLKMNRQTYFI